MIVSQIVAVSENYVIGRNNQLIWHFSEDLKYFKSKTMNKPLIMGRKTFNSFSNKPLPNRFHFVISKESHISEHKQVCYVKSLEEALEKARLLIRESKMNSKSEGQPTIIEDEIMIIGGAEIYRQSMSLVDKIYLTRIPGRYEGDVYYPQNISERFNLVSSLESLKNPGLFYEVWVKKI